jgi:D-alanyl-D-alanine carboxypeptidase
MVGSFTFAFNTIMKKLAFLPIVLFLALPFLSFGQASAYLADTLQKTLNAKAKSYKLNSAVAAVMLPDGSYWEGATGMSGLDSTKPHTLFEIGSNTKTFTSSLILQLADEGKLSLDDTIFKFLPRYPYIANGITIRQLLNHTSGIYNYTDNPDFASFVNNFIDAQVSPDSALKTWLGPMLFKPGSNWSYSNSNYILLGLIIEKIENRPYQVALRERLLKPLGLDNISLDPQEPYSLAKTGTWLSNGYFFDEHFVSFMSAAWSAGALVSTPVDLAEWAWKLYGGKVLPNHWLDSMRVGINLGGGIKYGLGMFQRTFLGKIYLGHGGTTLQNSEMDYSPTGNFSVVTVVNEQDKSVEARAIQNALIQLVDKLVDKAMDVKTLSSNAGTSIYPNPVSSQVTISLPTNISTPLSFNVYNLSGQLIYHRANQDNSCTLTTDGYKPGIYLIRVTNQEGAVIYADKILKQ